MFGKGRSSATGVRPRTAHSNPVIESRLLQIDLIRERIRDKQRQARSYHTQVELLLKRIRELPHQSEAYLESIEQVNQQIGQLEAAINELATQAEQQQKETEAAELRFLDRIAHGGESTP